MAGYRERLADFDAAGVQILALTAENEEDARAMREKVEPGFPILHGLDVGEMRDTIGCYVASDADPPYVHATGVLLDPEGRVRLVVYSSGAIGRLQPEPALATILHLQDEE